MPELTRSQLVAALRRADAAGDAKAAAAIARRIKAQEQSAKPKQKPKSFWQGAAEGAMPAAYNAVKIMNRVNPLLNVANIGGGLDRAADVGRAETKRKLDQTGYRGSTLGRITGAVLGTAPTLAIPGAGLLSAMGQGAASGALLSEDILDPAKAGPEAALGAVTGGLVKLGTDKVIAPGLRAVANSAPGRAALNAARLPKLTNAPKLSKVERVVRRAKPDFDAARANIDEAQALGLPYVAADASVPLRDLAGAARRFASPGVVDDAAEFASGRMVDRSTRGLSAIERDFGRTIDPEAAGAQIRNVANNRAGPFYEEAFSGGSTAPLENQLTGVFAISSQSVAQARANLAAAQRGATLTEAAVNRAGNNVYMNAKALPANRGSAQAIKAAETELAQAEGRHAMVLEQLRRAQSDAASNAPGAIWSPRIQEFIDDPLSKPALARGLEIQRIEALAAGRPFDPTEYAVTGFDDAGNPIVGNVPNMRTLDAIKRGYDAILDDYPRDISGKQVFDQRGRAITQAKQALLKELDGATGGPQGPYAQARGTYEQYIKRKSAMDLGMKAAQPSVEARNVARQVEGMDPKQRAMYERGFVTENVDALRSARSDTANPYDYLAGGLDRKDKLATLFPETTPQFLRQRQFEKDMAATSQELFGGSPTQIRKANDDAFKSAAMDAAADVGLDVIATGGALTPGTLASMLRKIKGNEGLGLLGAREKADALLPLLTSPNAGQEFQAMSARLLADEAQREAYRKAMGLLVAPTTAGLLSF